MQTAELEAWYEVAGDLHPLGVLAVIPEVTIFVHSERKVVSAVFAVVKEASGRLVRSG